MLTGENYRNLGVAVFREVSDTVRRYPSGFRICAFGERFSALHAEGSAIVGGTRRKFSRC